MVIEMVMAGLNTKPYFSFILITVSQDVSQKTKGARLRDLFSGLRVLREAQRKSE